MKKIAAILFWLVALNAQTFLFAAGPDWQPDYDAAKKMAREQNKILMVFYHNPESENSDFVNKTLDKSEIADKTKSYICVKLDVSKNKDYADEGQRYYPRFPIIQFFNSKNHQLYTLAGEYIFSTDREKDLLDRISIPQESLTAIESTRAAWKEKSAVEKKASLEYNWSLMYNYGRLCQYDFASGYCVTVAELAEKAEDWDKFLEAHRLLAHSYEVDKKNLGDWLGRLEESLEAIKKHDPLNEKGIYEEVLFIKITGYVEKARFSHLQRIIEGLLAEEGLKLKRRQDLKYQLAMILFRDRKWEECKKLLLDAIETEDNTDRLDNLKNMLESCEKSLNPKQPDKPDPEPEEKPEEKPENK